MVTSLMSRGSIHECEFLISRLRVSFVVGCRVSSLIFPNAWQEEYLVVSGRRERVTAAACGVFGAGGPAGVCVALNYISIILDVASRFGAALSRAGQAPTAGN